MKSRIYILCLLISMICSTTESFAQRGKTEIALGYGYWSLYNMANGQPYKNSSGTTALVIRHYFSKDITLGLGIGSENIKDYGSFTTFSPELTVNYLDTKDSRIRVRLYGSISYGISYFHDNNIGVGYADNSGVKAVGFNGSPFAMRIGRQFAFFAEIGVGYKGLFHTGLEIRVPRVLAKNRHHED